MAFRRTMAVNEAAYRALERLKRPRETCWDVILRQFRRRSYAELAGAWKNEPREQIQDFQRRLAEMRAVSDKELAEKVERFGP